ncbi:hypothetical protein IH980_01510 [Patescibacteria group bacterium]|nr:hypothetical protein [Patescibacteria group bacterium]
MLPQNASENAPQQESSFFRGLLFSSLGALTAILVLTTVELLLQLVGFPIASKSPSSIRTAGLAVWATTSFAYVAWFSFRKNSWRQVFRKSSPLLVGLGLIFLMYYLVIVLFLR